jgi:hypothetical protein
MMVRCSVRNCGAQGAGAAAQGGGAQLGGGTQGAGPPSAAMADHVGIVSSSEQTEKHLIAVIRYSFTRVANFVCGAGEARMRSSPVTAGCKTRSGIRSAASLCRDSFWRGGKRRDEMFTRYFGQDA